MSAASALARAIASAFSFTLRVASNLAAILFAAFSLANFSASCFFCASSAAFFSAATLSARAFSKPALTAATFARRSSSTRAFSNAAKCAFSLASTARRCCSAWASICCWAINVALSLTCCCASTIRCASCWAAFAWALLSSSSKRCFSVASLNKRSASNCSCTLVSALAFSIALINVSCCCTFSCAFSCSLRWRASSIWSKS